MATALIIRKHVPKGVELSDFALADPTNDTTKTVPGAVRAEQSADAQGRLYTITASALPPVDRATAAPGGCGVAPPNIAVLKYSVHGLEVPSAQLPDLTLTTSPQRLRPGKAQVVEVTARVQLPENATGAAQFAIPEVLAGGLVELRDCSEGAQVAVRPPATVLGWPVKGAREAEFRCRIELTPSAEGEVLWENAFSLRLITKGLPAAQLVAPTESPAGLSSPRLLVLHVPLALQVRSR